MFDRLQFWFVRRLVSSLGGGGVILEDRLDPFVAFEDLERRRMEWSTRGGVMWGI